MQAVCQFSGCFHFKSEPNSDSDVDAASVPVLLGDVVQVDLRRWRAVMVAAVVVVVVVDSSVSHPGLRTPGGGLEGKQPAEPSQIQ